ncbi:hypothetical protein E2P81_ATG10274 [Venturia nashicola]|nr:hypothetical protein E2P81_ATG10274 [Venturia nashicola]
MAIGHCGAYCGAAGLAADNLWSRPSFALRVQISWRLTWQYKNRRPIATHAGSGPTTYCAFANIAKRSGDRARLNLVCPFMSGSSRAALWMPHQSTRTSGPTTLLLELDPRSNALANEAAPARRVLHIRVALWKRDLNHHRAG